MRTTQVRLLTADDHTLELGIDAAGRWAEPEVAWERIELTESVAVPGLVDAHAHLTSSDPSQMNGASDATIGERIASHAADQLAGGVLLVADKGTHLVESVAATLEIDPAARPEVQAAGRFLANPGGYYHGYAIEVDGAEATGAIDRVTPPDATWLKLIGDWPRRGQGAVPNFTEQELAGIVDAASGRGLRTAIHTAAPETPTRAVRAGVDSIEHGLFLTEDDVAMLGARGGAWVPTVAAMEMLADQLGPASSGGRLLAEGLGNVRRLLPHAVAAGVAVMAGTDLALPHGAVADEAERMIAYGMSEADAVAALTTAAREYLAGPAFEIGQPADFTLVSDPAAISSLRRPQLVVRCGRIVGPAGVAGGLPRQLPL